MRLRICRAGFTVDTVVSERTVVDRSELYRPVQEDAMRIDVHAHLWSESYLAQLDDFIEGDIRDALLLRVRESRPG